MTDRIAIYSGDAKSEARLRREQDERRAAMLREQASLGHKATCGHRKLSRGARWQVLKCEKDLLDECELRQEADRWIETVLISHLTPILYKKTSGTDLTRI